MTLVRPSSISVPLVTASKTVGPGVDPHLYKATASDISALAEADLIFYHGLHLEGRMTEVFDKMKIRGEQVWPVTQTIPKERLIEPDGLAGEYDPHIWFSPLLWAECVSVVVEGYSTVDPENSTLYRQRGEALVDEYHALHAWGIQRIQQLPQERRILVTSHDAFNYFGRAYGFKVLAVQGISTVAEASLVDMSLMIDFIKQHRVPAIFVESSVSPTAIQRISSDSGAIIGGELFSDAMGVIGDWETRNGETYDLGTFSGMYKHNINVIVDTLLATSGN